MPQLNKTGLSIAEMTDEERLLFGIEDDTPIVVREDFESFMASIGDWGNGVTMKMSLVVSDEGSGIADMWRVHRNLDVEYFQPVAEAERLNAAFVCPKCGALDATSLGGKVCRDCIAAKQRARRSNGATGNGDR